MFWGTLTRHNIYLWFEDDKNLMFYGTQIENNKTQLIMNEQKPKKDT